MAKISNELKVAITVVISLIVAFLGFRIMQDMPLFRQSLQVYTKFDRVDGLNTGNYIYINGVKVGSVQQIQLGENDSVLVSLGFDLGLDLPKGSVAYLESSGLLDEKAIIIERGDSDEQVGYGDHVKGVYRGGMMEILETEGKKLSSDLSSSFGKLDTLLEQLNSTLDKNTQDNVKGTISNLEETTNEVSRLLKNKRSELESSIDHVNSVLATLDTLSTGNKERIDSVLIRLDRSLNELETLSSNLQTTTVQLNNILQKIDNGEGSLGMMVNNPSLYNNIDSLAFELKTLVKNINEQPNKYLKHMRLIEVF